MLNENRIPPAGLCTNKIKCKSLHPSGSTANPLASLRGLARNIQKKVRTSLVKDKKCLPVVGVSVLPQSKWRRTA